MQNSIVERLADTKVLRALGEHGPVLPGSPLWRQIRKLVDSSDRINPFIAELRKLDRERTFFPLGEATRLLVFSREFKRLQPREVGSFSPAVSWLAEEIRGEEPKL